MTSLFLTLLAPVLVLWIAACVFYVLDQLVRPQDAGVAEAVVLLLAIGALLWGTRLSPAGTGQAQYAELAVGQALTEAGWPGVSPALRVDRTTKALALVLLVTAAAASLASLAESGLMPTRDAAAPRVAGRAGRVAALGAALLLIFAGDWATAALAWVMCDLALLYARPATVSHADAPETRWSIGLSLVGAICLGLVVIVSPQEGEAPSALAAGLGLAAVVLRLLPWPLPAWPLPFSSRHTLLVRVHSFLVPALLSAHLCSQLAPWVWSADLGAERVQWLAVARGSVLAVWAAAALLVSSFKAWSAREPGVLISCTTLYGVALIFLGCALNLPSSWLRLVGVGTVLSVCALSVSWTMCPYLDPDDPRTWWRVVPVGVAFLSFAGLPLTLGFEAQAALYSALVSESRWLVLLALIAAQAGMLGALLRVLLDVECVLPDSSAAAGLHAVPHPHRWQRGVAFGAGTVLAVGIFVLGIRPSLLGAPGLGTWFGVLGGAAWAALLLPVAGGVFLYRKQERITAWMEEWAPVAERLLDARGLYRAVGWVVRGLGDVVWNASLVIEGAGYMAWVTLFGLVVLLLVLASR